MLLHLNFSSQALHLATGVYVILPEPERDWDGNQVGEYKSPFPTLWLLHGMSDDHTIWQRRTGIELYADGYPLAVVMPEVGRSFYADMHAGLKYWTYLTVELPELLRAMLPLSDRREDNFVAGLSMGGYGAFKWALTYPERFAGAASLSGALNITTRVGGPDKQWRKESRAIFGSFKNLPGSPHDLFHLAEQLAGSPYADLPLYQCCGTEDILYQDNQLFRKHAQNLGLNLTYEEGAANHTWDYWDRQIQRVLEWTGVPQKTPFNPWEALIKQHASKRPTVSRKRTSQSGKSSGADAAGG
jgi:S-formylglutathione hydrolase FrmB